jgi:hypothetical protein
MILRRLHALMVLAAAAVLSACASDPDERAFADYQSLMLSIGKMRGDVRPADVPYDAATLAENFRRIAFFEVPDDRNRSAKRLTRWNQPIRYALYGSDLARHDTQLVDGLMRRASRLTGLQVINDTARPNFLIFVLAPGEEVSPPPVADDPEVLQDLDALARYAWDCSVHAYTRGTAQSEITTAIVYVRAAVKGFYRQACLHEEIFQGLGLFADDETVRPSIFNDDEEFALLTEHDEHLVRILYDPRLRIGMRAEEAMPTVSRIAEDLRTNGVR